MEATNDNRRLPMAWAPFVIVILSLLSACSQPDGPGESEGADQEEKSQVIVEVVTLEETDFIERLSLTGETEPIRAASIASEAAGRIVELHLDEGAQVSEGETLVRVDTSQQSAQAGQLRAQLEQVESDIRRTERLLDRGLATESDLEQLRTQKASLEEQLRGVYIGVGSGTTKAPFDGQIVRKDTEIGEFANPGAPLGRIIDISQLKVIVDLPEREIGTVTEGQSARVQIPALGERVEGEIARIGAEADTRSRTFPVEVIVDNPDGRLRAGMRARVEIKKSHLENVVVAPLDSLMQGIDGTEAVVVRDGLAYVVQVTVGPTRGNYAVISEGISAGAELVVRGQNDLVNEEPVQAVNIGSCCIEQLKSYGVTTNTQSANRESISGSENESADQ
jgi:membrane fusion protein (multidrug efflux system)